MVVDCIFKRADVYRTDRGLVSSPGAGGQFLRGDEVHVHVSSGVASVLFWRPCSKHHKQTQPITSQHTCTSSSVTHTHTPTHAQTRTHTHNSITDSKYSNSVQEIGCCNPLQSELYCLGAHTPIGSNAKPWACELCHNDSRRCSQRHCAYFDSLATDSLHCRVSMELFLRPVLVC